MPEEKPRTQVEPIRCFEGNAKPHEAFWKWNDAAEGGEPEMELYGYISEYSWFDDDITPKMFKDDLNRYGQGGPITIRMHSYGGDVVAASLMAGIIRDYPGKVTVQIDGVAASAATVVAIAGDQVRMQETSYFMIHDPSVIFFLAQLNIEDLTRLASSLQAVKEGIVNAYETRTGLSRSRLSKMMTEETWMDAQRAVDLGFADEMIRGGVIPAGPVENVAVVNAVKNFKNVPDKVREMLAPPTPPIVPLEMSESEQREAETLRERVQNILRKEK